MTCTHIGDGIVCVNPWGRLKVGNRYVWVSFHSYCGPEFFTDANMSKFYGPVDENDPVWPEFSQWLNKYRAAKAKAVIRAARIAMKNSRL